MILFLTLFCWKLLLNKKIFRSYDLIDANLKILDSRKSFKTKRLNFFSDAPNLESYLFIFIHS